MTMVYYTAIIERLEKADGPDAWTSHLIAVAVGVYPADGIEAINHDAKVVWFRKGQVQDPCPDYTASLDAAIALCERMLPGCDYTVKGGKNEQSANIVAGGFGKDVTFTSSRRREASPAIGLSFAIAATVRLAVVELWKGQDDG
jgi:hypothetical protein